MCKRLSLLGVDLIDVSTAGLDPRQQIPVGPGYQVPFARMVREGSGLPVAAVGLITEAQQAEQVLVEGSADAVLLARAVLRNPHWPLQAAAELGDDIAWPDPVRASQALDAPGRLGVMGHVEVSQLRYVLPDGRVLLDDVNFRVGEGSKVALVGANGTGKTTLMRVVAGDTNPDAGGVVAVGRPRRHAPVRRLGPRRHLDPRPAAGRQSRPAAEGRPTPSTTPSSR